MKGTKRLWKVSFRQPLKVSEIYEHSGYYIKSRSREPQDSVWNQLLFGDWSKRSGGTGRGDKGIRTGFHQL
jgi:hypothetical protein